MRDASGPRGEIPTEVPAGGDFRSFLKWRRERKRLIKEHEKRGEKLPQVSPRAGVGLADGTDVAAWGGHATVISRLDGHTVLHDPVWSSRLVWFLKRLSPVAPKWDDVPRPELVTLSHNHYDHMDAPTLKRLRRSATICVPRGDKAWFTKRRFRNVEEFEWWQTRDLAGLKVTFVPSKHFSGRTPWDRDKSLYGSWVLEGKQHTVYHAGDTGYFDGFQAIGDRFRKIDLACLPIGAYEPRWFMRPFHVNPEEAGQAFLDVRARQFLPIHWGTFRLSDEAMDEPPLRIRMFFEAHGLEPGRLWLPDLGEVRPLSGEPQPNRPTSS